MPNVINNVIFVAVYLIDCEYMYIRFIIVFVTVAATVVHSTVASLCCSACYHSQVSVQHPRQRPRVVHVDWKEHAVQSHKIRVALVFCTLTLLLVGLASIGPSINQSISNDCDGGKQRATNNWGGAMLLYQGNGKPLAPVKSQRLGRFDLREGERQECSAGTGWPCVEAILRVNG